MEKLIVIWGNGYVGEYEKRGKGYYQISNLHEEVFWEVFRKGVFKDKKDTARFKFIRGNDMEKFAATRDFIF
ncbi:MAG: hypothetical protein K0R54_6146 [Clostridiaceae bacterium]|jgi:hypothetical protein|nr:hypothetical protein [Clostridiaceae bacterium]MDF2950446.1 hypothetical protein [Anaerocolumna sp.]